jgi:hypothetical protein
MQPCIRRMGWLLSLGLLSVLASTAAAAQAPRGPVIVPSAVSSPSNVPVRPEGAVAAMPRLTMPPLTREQYSHEEAQWMLAGMAVGLVAGVVIVDRLKPASESARGLDPLKWVLASAVAVGGSVLGGVLFRFRYGPPPPAYAPPPDIVPRDMKDPG